MKKITVKLIPIEKVNKEKAIKAIKSSINEVRQGVYSF